MGGGGSSSSSNTTTSTNTSGQNAIQGDNLGVAVSGVNDSTINVKMTDHGAMDKAADLAELALTNNSKVTSDALRMGEKVTGDALRMGENSVKQALGFGEKALDKNAEVAQSAMKHVSTSHSENLQHVSALAGNQAAQNSKNLEAMKELAVMKTDGGQIETNKQMAFVMVAVVVCLMVAFVFMAKGRK